MRLKVVVLGATGFIGRNTAEVLAERHPEWDIRGVYHSRAPFAHRSIQFVQADLRSLEEARRAIEGADMVIQAAATTSGAKDIVERPYIHVTGNAVMNAHVLQAAFEQKVKQFLFFSCSVMYPSAAHVQSELDFPDPEKIHPRYFGVAQTKLYIESLLRFYAGLMKGSGFVALRHSNIFGPHDKFDLERSHVCGASITKVMQAKDCVKVWGSGEEARDLLYIEDLCDLVDRVLTRPASGFLLLNAGSGAAVSVNELITEIIRLSGKNLRLEHELDRPSIPSRILLDSSRAKDLFDWRPAHTLEDGLRKTLGWLSAQRF